MAAADRLTVSGRKGQQQLGKTGGSPGTFGLLTPSTSTAPANARLFSGTRTSDSEVYTAPLPRASEPEPKERWSRQRWAAVKALQGGLSRLRPQGRGAQASPAPPSVPLPHQYPEQPPSKAFCYNHRPILLLSVEMEHFFQMQLLSLFIPPPHPP